MTFNSRLPSHNFSRCVVCLLFSTYTTLPKVVRSSFLFSQNLHINWRFFPSRLNSFVYNLNGENRELNEYERVQVVGLWKAGKIHEAIGHILKIPKSTVTDTIARQKIFTNLKRHCKKNGRKLCPKLILI